jgi:hypothetical protein
MRAKNSKKNSRAAKVYRVQILAPDSPTKWRSLESPTTGVAEMSAKPGRRKQPRRGDYVVIAKSPAAAA